MLLNIIKTTSIALRAASKLSQLVRVNMNKLRISETYLVVDLIPAYEMNQQSSIIGDRYHLAYEVPICRRNIKEISRFDHDSEVKLLYSLEL